MRHRGLVVGLASVLLLGTGSSASAAERAGHRLEILVDGAPLPEHRLGERVYVEALAGRNFHLRVVNPERERVAVAISVDGRNVIDARRTTALAGAKWVLAPGEVLEIPGWQISGETARKFFFTETESSYAKWLGDTRNVGTIEAVFFRESRREPPRIAKDRPAGDVSAEEPIASGGEALAAETSRRRAQRRDSDRYAATGAGERTEFPVQRVSFTEDPTPVAHVRLRYEFYPELVRLGVLLPKEDLHARERGRGFEREYAPDPRPER